MRRQLVIASAATALLLAIGTAGTMAQTPYGSSSQSAPPGMDHNPAAESGRTATMSSGRTAGTMTKSKKLRHHARRPVSRTTGTGSSSQSAPPGMDYNPATRSR
jgi:hypothetical protein